MSSAASKTSRQSPSPGPVAPARPRSAPPPFEVAGVERYRLVGADREGQRLVARAGVVDGFDAHFAALVGVVGHAHETLQGRVRCRGEERDEEGDADLRQERLLGGRAGGVRGGYRDRGGAGARSLERDRAAVDLGRDDGGPGHRHAVDQRAAPGILEEVIDIDHQTLPRAERQGGRLAHGTRRADGRFGNAGRDLGAACCLAAAQGNGNLVMVGASRVDFPVQERQAR